MGGLVITEKRMRMKKIVVIAFANLVVVLLMTGCEGFST